MGNGTTGTVPLRPLGATELLDAAVRTVWERRRAILPITVPATVVVTALGALLAYAAAGDTDLSFGRNGASLLIGVLASTVLAGLVAPVVGAAAGGSGRPMTAGDALRATGVRVFALGLLAVVVTLAEGVGLVLLLVGGVWLWGVWAVCAPALTLERIGPFAALRRSFALVRGDFWRVWGVRALGWTVTVVVRLVAALPFDAIGLWVGRVHSFGQAGQYIERPGLYTAVVTVGALIGGLVTIPVSASVDVLLYVDLRMRREGMDIVMGLPPRPADLVAAPRAATPAW